MSVPFPRLAALLVALAPALQAARQDPEREFFEARVRPVLVAHCYRCHNSADTAKGGLRLDHRDGLRRGGKSGAAIVPGDAGRSLLIRLVRHEDDARRMPDEGPRLDDAVIADLTRWIDAGAADPRDEPPSPEQLAELSSWDAVRTRRAQWWSWQPPGAPAVPEVADASWSARPIDRFVLARLEEAGLRPAPRVDRAALLRRVTFALTGLPPTPREIDAFVGDPSPEAYERVVDRLLASPRFGERWARHWMDWVRYADSHGSEGDPAIPHAWRYRDYLIRALNADVGFDQLVREHVAGDLLPEPRMNAELGIVESVLGAAQYRFVQHGFAPTDALDEKVRFVDNQVDVLTKSFLGLTVSCARCHDHKFDAISQTDYYALFGCLATARPALVTIDVPGALVAQDAALAAQKDEIAEALADAWRPAADGIFRVDPDGLAGAADDELSPLHAWARVRAVGPDAIAATWEQLVAAWRASRDRLAARAADGTQDGAAAGAGLGRWFADGAGIAAGPSPPGAFHVLPEGDRIVADVLPAGVYSHLLSSKHRGVLTSPTFVFDMPVIYVRVAGDGGARARYVVQGYPRGGTVYPIHTMRGGQMQWVRWDTGYWAGDRGYLEVTTAADQPVEADTGAVRSWFGLTDFEFVSTAQDARGDVPRDEPAEFVTPLFVAAGARAPTSVEDLRRVYAAALRTCIDAWSDRTIDDAQARFLGFFVRSGLLPTRLSELEDAGDLAGAVAAYRALEAEVPVARRAPGQLESEPRDQPLFVRGDHRVPGDPVPRRFLESIDPTPYAAGEAGGARLRLAEDFVRADNPFTARVAVNRIWHHLFGRGLVSTPDNFGHLGERPTHPELLDWLARRFVAAGWSMKALIRDVVLSETFRMDARGRERAAEVDPSNLLRSHFDVRRLEAEAIRDALLAVSGRLDLTMYGPPVDGGAPRRSVYLRVRRNDLDPFLTVFDAPEPHSTRGRRDATNVPAQSLTLLNDPFVIDAARSFADAVLADPAFGDDAQRVIRMFVTAFGRAPTDAELRRSLAFVDGIDAAAKGLARDVERLEGEARAARAELAALCDPVRARVLVDRRVAGGAVVHGPVPLASWEFDDDVEDARGALHGRLRGSARLERGAVVLDGAGYVETAPLAEDLGAKTLEAWVELSELDQRGGGVVSVESIGGGSFDAIVFGEKDPRQWLPGSDSFRRTRSVDGPAETDAAARPVHVAITYAADGTITAYRDGEPYGRAYRSDGPRTFRAAESVVLIGLRHSPAGGNKFLRGRVLRARLYGRALSADEVLASARGGAFVSRADLLAAMNDAARAEHARLEERIRAADEARAALGVPDGLRTDRGRAWADLAQSLFNLKEFLFVR